MSLQFSDTTTYKGLIQIYEKEIGATRGDVSGDSNKLKEFTADANLALDSYLQIAFDSSGTWQFDDSNQTDFPEIFTTLTDGRRDYTFTTDGTGNLILDIYRVFILPSATSSVYQEIFSVDQQSDSGTESFTNGQAAEGVPSRYDKTANGIFLDPVPSYTKALGLKVMINREASYFTSADTTKKPGVPGNHHSYFYLKPAMDYARRNNLANYNKIAQEVAKLEQETIPSTFSRRERDKKTVMGNEFQDYE